MSTDHSPYHIPDPVRKGVGHTDTTSMHLAHDEMKRMLELMTDRLEVATKYKGDETSEWAYKEVDKFWVQCSRGLLEVVGRLERGFGASLS